MMEYLEQAWAWWLYCPDWARAASIFVLLTAAWFGSRRLYRWFRRRPKDVVAREHDFIRGRNIGKWKYSEVVGIAGQSLATGMLLARDNDGLLWPAEVGDHLDKLAPTAKASMDALIKKPPYGSKPVVVAIEYPPGQKFKEVHGLNEKGEEVTEMVPVSEPPYGSKPDPLDRLATMRDLEALEAKLDPERAEIRKAIADLERREKWTASVQPPTRAPEYEPIGTLPVVGDKIWRRLFGESSGHDAGTAASVDFKRDLMTYESGGFDAVSYVVQGDPLRILKREATRDPRINPVVGDVLVSLGNECHFVSDPPPGTEATSGCVHFWEEGSRRWTTKPVWRAIHNGAKILKRGDE